MVKRRSIILYPLSLIYGLVTGLRNFLYTEKVLPSFKFDIPVISVGNITAGGTGKTPHTEYLADLLKIDFKVATLSRGYKRKTKGFHIASPSSDVKAVGDEPLQICRKFPGITVAVDTDRVHGINSILRERPGTSVIILDDAFQHRKITPGLSILLSDFTQPVTRDHLLPYGNLRENISNIRRADIIVITKTPENLSADVMRMTEQEIKKAPHQELFFTSLKYMVPVPVFAENPIRDISGHFPGKDAGIILVTGIGNPWPLKEYVAKNSGSMIHLGFPDHHRYNANDLAKIRLAWKNLRSPVKYILTTEKDAVRLSEFINVDEPLRLSIYYIPIGILFLNREKEKFDKLIFDYVGKNK